MPKLNDVVCFVGGTYIFTSNLFAFYPAKDSFIHYGASTEFAIAVGSCLIVIGFIRRSWAKKGQNSS